MSGLSVADVLDGAADLIKPEGRWTQGEGARDAAAAVWNDYLRRTQFEVVAKLREAARLARGEVCPPPPRDAVVLPLVVGAWWAW